MPRITMRDVFNDCQESIHNRTKHIKNLTNVYNATPIEEFWDQFLHHLKYNMIVFKREAAVERTLEFVARFATSLAGAMEDREKEATDEKEEADAEMHPLLLKLINFLLKSYRANSKAVRFRVCQLLNKLLNNMGEEAQIDDDLYDRIYECMLERLRDKQPIVRVHAVLAISRLQDPTDHDCPIMNAYLFIMKCDPSVEARRTVLSVIAASTKTLPAILERTRDVDDSVRRQAYQVIAEKVNIRALTIAQRERLLQEGLTDRVERVREACSSRLLQAWLRTYQGNILELLECLDVENSVETAELALANMLKRSPVADLVQNFDILDEKLVINKASMSPEAVLYWRCLCQYLVSLGTEGEAHLEKILPSVTVFSNYLRSTHQDMKAETDLEAQLRNEFIIQQLLSLAAVLDLSDEAGRKQFGAQLRQLLMDEGISHTLVKVLVARYAEYQQDAETRVAQLTELISDIREPITVVETGGDVEDRRQADLKLARIRVELNQLRDELELCVAQQDFSRASEVKARVTELDVIKQTLLEATKPQSQQVRKEKTDPQTLLKCLTIACEMQEDPKVCRLSPALQTLCEVLILPGIQNEDAAVRNAALKALGMCCLVSRDLARDHLLLFMQVCHMDQESIKVTALTVILDLLLVFGLDAFGAVDNEQLTNGTAEETDKNLNTSGDSEMSTLTTSEEEPEKTDNAKRVSNILSILTGLLDSESSEIRTVVAEGLCKLVLAGRVLSAKLLSRLLLLWYNPVTEGDGILRHCLGTFFPMYAFASRANQEVIEEAFMPTLSTLFDAPDTSPLAEVEANNVADLLVQLTNSRHLLGVSNNNAGEDGQQPDCLIHANIAVKVCNAILSDPKCFTVSTLCMVLNRLELAAASATDVRDLGVLADRMVKAVRDKLCLRMLERFRRTVRALLRSVAEGEDDQATGEQSEEMEELTRKLSETQVETEADTDTTVTQNGKRRRNKRLGDPSKSILTGKNGRSVRSTRASHSSSSEEEEEEEEGREQLENSAFGTPTPVREGAETHRARAGRAAGLAATRKNLEELLSDTDTQSDTEPTAGRANNKRHTTRTSRATRQSRVPLGGIDNEVP